MNVKKKEEKKSHCIAQCSRHSLYFDVFKAFYEIDMAKMYEIGASKAKLLRSYMLLAAVGLNPTRDFGSFYLVKLSS
jgi:hypothetical protein